MEYSGRAGSPHHLATRRCSALPNLCMCGCLCPASCTPNTLLLHPCYLPAKFQQPYWLHAHLQLVCSCLWCGRVAARRFSMPVTLPRNDDAQHCTHNSAQASASAQLPQSSGCRALVWQRCSKVAGAAVLPSTGQGRYAMQLRCCMKDAEEDTDGHQNNPFKDKGRLSWQAAMPKVLA